MDKSCEHIECIDGFCVSCGFHARPISLTYDRDYKSNVSLLQHHKNKIYQKDEYKFSRISQKLRLMNRKDIEEDVFKLIEQKNIPSKISLSDQVCGFAYYFLKSKGSGVLLVDFSEFTSIGYDKLKKFVYRYFDPIPNTEEYYKNLYIRIQDYFHTKNGLDLNDMHHSSLSNNPLPINSFENRSTYLKNNANYKILEAEQLSFPNFRSEDELVLKMIQKITGLQNFQNYIDRFHFNKFLSPYYIPITKRLDAKKDMHRFTSTKIISAQKRIQTKKKEIYKKLDRMDVAIEYLLLKKYDATLIQKLSKKDIMTLYYQNL